MFEKVSPSHPDKIADRIAGALVDLCYLRSDFPKVACEVLLGHRHCVIMIESSEMLDTDDIYAAVQRLADDVQTFILQSPQDAHLAHNQEGGVKCGDNGIFKGVPPTHEQKLLTAIAASIYERCPYDGKYILADAGQNPDFDALMTIPARTGRFKTGQKHLTICQSHARNVHIYKILTDFKRRYTSDTEIKATVRINPLGEWTGGLDVDCGATNRKLGSDMGDGVTGGGLHGKDLSKADVSVNIVCFLKAVASGQVVKACCSIGDEKVTFQYHDGKTETMAFSDVVEQAREYIKSIGGFEKFSEWGLIRPKAE